MDHNATIQKHETGTALGDSTHKRQCCKSIEVRGVPGVLFRHATTRDDTGLFKILLLVAGEGAGSGSNRGITTLRWLSSATEPRQHFTASVNPQKSDSSEQPKPRIGQQGSVFSFQWSVNVECPLGG